MESEVLKILTKIPARAKAGTIFKKYRAISLSKRGQKVNFSRNFKSKKTRKKLNRLATNRPSIRYLTSPVVFKAKSPREKIISWTKIVARLSYFRFCRARKIAQRLKAKESRSMTKVAR